MKISKRYWLLNPDAKQVIEMKGITFEGDEEAT